MKNPLLVILFYFLLGAGGTFASTIEISPQNTQMTGSIPYTVIGTYEAQFDSFDGKVILDPERQIRSVYLAIEVKSIDSNCPWCDKMARSRRLLNATRFPKIIFKSERISRYLDDYKIEGILEMHGIAKRMAFTFKYQRGHIQGRWRINRKSFGVIWSRTLDKGGIVVGDYFTVDWNIKV